MPRFYTGSCEVGVLIKAGNLCESEIVNFMQ